MDDMLKGGWQTAGFVDRELLQEQSAESGMSPRGHVVLVYPDPVATETEGGIALPEDIRMRAELGQTFGYCVALGPHCWYDEPEPRCEVGDRIMFAKHAGQIYTGPDGRRYRAMNDKDILAVVSAEVKE